jgi:hypothetical protein
MSDCARRQSCARRGRARTDLHNELSLECAETLHEDGAGRALLGHEDGAQRAWNRDAVESPPGPSRRASAGSSLSVGRSRHRGRSAVAMFSNSGGATRVCSTLSRVVYPTVIWYVRYSRTRTAGEPAILEGPMMSGRCTRQPAQGHCRAVHARQRRGKSNSSPRSKGAAVASQSVDIVAVQLRRDDDGVGEIGRGEREGGRARCIVEE